MEGVRLGVVFAKDEEAPGHKCGFAEALHCYRRLRRLDWCQSMAKEIRMSSHPQSIMREKKIGPGEGLHNDEAAVPRS